MRVERVKCTCQTSQLTLVFNCNICTCIYNVHVSITHCVKLKPIMYLETKQSGFYSASFRLSFLSYTHMCVGDQIDETKRVIRKSVYSRARLYKRFNRNIFYKPWRPKVFFQYGIIINVLVMSFRFIWIPMLWVHVHYTYFTLAVRGKTLDIYRRQILTSKFNPRAVSVSCYCCYCK